MTKDDLTKKLGVSKETLESVIRSCGYTDIKSFNVIHESVMKSFIKKAQIKDYASEQEKKQIDNETIQETSLSQVKTEIINNIVEREVVTVVRKELIELISRAYHKGIEDGKNSIFIADKNKLDEIFEEAINK